MMQQPRKKRSDSGGRNDYATRSDFCAVFHQHLDRLYLLALILTGDELTAEKCFLAAFDSCAEERLVFKESAVSWSRRSVIKSAISFMLPALRNSSRPHLLDNPSGLNLDRDASLKQVRELPPFDRFVFVKSVLERYSDRECALLLGCSCADILPARIRAFKQISTRDEKRYPDNSSGNQPYVVDADWLECG